MLPDQKKSFLSYGYVVFAWLLVNASLYSRYGIKIVNDSERYLEYGRGLAEGFYIDDFNFWYVGYALFLATLIKFGGGIVAVAVFQYFISFVAVLALYKASLILWESRNTAEFVCAFFLCFIDISQWNSYVLTESLYTSFTCISIYCLVRLHKGERRWWFVLVTAGAVVFTIFMKPTGVALLGALAIAMVFRIEHSRVRIAALVFLGVSFAFLLNRMLANYLVMENYQAGEVIYAVSTYKDQSMVEGLVVQPPADIYIPPVSYPPLFRIVAFIFHHPLYWINLFSHKVFYLLSHIRPFWSVGHNLFSIAILLCAYTAFITGIRDKSIGRDVVIFAAAYLVIHILSIGITSEDWDGRFLIPMLPVIFIFSGHGIATWRYRKSTQQLP